jgi:hypothetical protein
MNPDSDRRADYMDERRVFTMDPQYFPTARMREIIDYLHKYNQRYGTYRKDFPSLFVLTQYV